MTNLFSCRDSKDSNEAKTMTVGSWWFSGGWWQQSWGESGWLLSCNCPYNGFLGDGIAAARPGKSASGGENWPIGRGRSALSNCTFIVWAGLSRQWKGQMQCCNQGHLSRQWKEQCNCCNQGVWKWRLIEPHRSNDHNDHTLIFPCCQDFHNAIFYLRHYTRGGTIALSSAKTKLQKCL